MSLSKEDVDGLLGLLSATEETEVNCDGCLPLVAEFAERELAGKPIHAALETVRQHLSVCGECREEYESLCLTLEDLSDTGSGDAAMA